MKKLIVMLVALVLSSAAFADRDYGRHGGGHHRGPSFGQAVLGTAVLVGAAVVLDRMLAPQQGVVYYAAPICRIVFVPVTDAYGRQLYDVYGRPLHREAQVCQ